MMLSLPLRNAALSAVVVGASLFGGSVARADGSGDPTAEITIIHARHCADKHIDPKITEPPPAMGYECLDHRGHVTLTLKLNQPGDTDLPNGRKFRLVHTGRGADGKKYNVTAFVNQPDGSFSRLADVSADPHKPFNVGGFAHEGGVLLLTVKIIPASK